VVGRRAGGLPRGADVFVLARRPSAAFARPRGRWDASAVARGARLGCADHPADRPAHPQTQGWRSVPLASARVQAMHADGARAKPSYSSRGMGRACATRAAHAQRVFMRVHSWAAVPRPVRLTCLRARGESKRGARSEARDHHGLGVRDHSSPERVRHGMGLRMHLTLMRSITKCMLDLYHKLRYVSMRLRRHNLI
jgi:hypothetical protein